MNRRIPIGILFSTQGPYATVGRAMHDGAMLALEEVNQDERFPFELMPMEYEPAGDIAAYRTYAKNLLRDQGVKHVIGCYTSSSRKEVIPTFEKYDGLLWYPSHYEGFETNNNVIYTGAVQNQHILPLMDYVLLHISSDVYFVGSNYVWAWENGRIIREVTNMNGGKMLAERYLQVGDRDVSRIIEEIHEKTPAFIMNMLIGETSYEFYRAFSKARGKNPALKDAVIGSCTLCEPELAEIGPQACSGHLVSSVYFSSIRTVTNTTFVENFQNCYGKGVLPGADAESSYNTVHLLARSLARAGSDKVERVKEALHETEFQAPQGMVQVDPENNHSYLTVRLGLSCQDGTFRIVSETDAPVRPDPYLVWAEGGVERNQPKLAIARNGVELRLVK